MIETFSAYLHCRRHANLVRAGLAAGFVLLMTAGASAGQKPDLRVSSVRCVALHVEDLAPEEEAVGVSTQQLRDALVVGIMAKAPRLQVGERCADAHLYLRVSLGSVKASYYYGDVMLQLRRPAMIGDSPVMIGAWDKGVIFTGGSGPAPQVLRLVDGLVTQFAAEYDRANP